MTRKRIVMITFCQGQAERAGGGTGPGPFR
jgi:hypothetical protein